MAAYNFPGIDFSLPFHPSPQGISTYSPFSYSTPKPFDPNNHDEDQDAVSIAHDYGSFHYPTTPDSETPNTLRTLDFFSNSNSPASFSSIASSRSSLSLASQSKSRSSSCTTYAAPTQFSHFTSLPLELQRRIWRHTLPAPRIVEILKKPSTSSDTSLSQFQSTTASYPLPIALRIHRLSRRVALTHYTELSLGHPYYLPLNPYSYIDYTCDTIFLSTSSLYEGLGNDILYSRNLNLIQNLAVEFEAWTTLLGDNHFVNALLEMEGLVGIWIVFERELDGGVKEVKEMRELNLKGISRRREEVRFTEVAEYEMREVEKIFERGCEKCWLWGRVKGWEDVRGKLGYWWRERDSVTSWGSRDGRISVDFEVDAERCRRISSREYGEDGNVFEDGNVCDDAGDEEKGNNTLSVESLMESLDDVIGAYGDMGNGDAGNYSESEYSYDDEERRFHDDLDDGGWI